MDHHTVNSTTSTTTSWSSADDRTVVPSPPRPDRNGSRIRRNLLYKLGMHHPHSDEYSSKGLESSAGRRRPCRSLLGDVRKSTIPLKCDQRGREEETERSTLRKASRGALEGTATGSAMTSPFPQHESLNETERSLSFSLSSSSDYSAHEVLSSSGSQCPIKPMKKLTFDNEVLVCPIPKRTEYSKRMKDCLWTTSADSARISARNAIEFAAEGNDWRHVLEDGDMYRDPVTQEMIHPIHIELWREQSGMDYEDFFTTKDSSEDHLY